MPASRRVDRFVTDTHPLIWFAGGVHRKLGKKALAAFRAYEEGEARLFVPTPVVIETWFLAQSGSLRLDTSLERWWKDIAHPLLTYEPLTAEDVFMGTAMPWAHRDPYDRLIVATTRRLGLPLISADGEIEDSGQVEVLW